LLHDRSHLRFFLARPRTGGHFSIRRARGLSGTITLNLEAAGLRVECIADGMAALSRLDEPPPDAVILTWGCRRSAVSG